MDEMDNAAVVEQQPTDQKAGIQKFRETYQKTESIIGKVIMFFYHIRKVVLAAPVVYAAIKLAMYNNEHLPEMVGVNMLPSGEFAQQIAKNLAVLGPLGITLACLLLMFCSRKALYAWAISLFTLVLPVLLLLSNQYPA